MVCYSRRRSFSRNLRYLKMKKKNQKSKKKEVEVKPSASVPSVTTLILPSVIDSINSEFLKEIEKPYEVKKVESEIHIVREGCSDCVIKQKSNKEIVTSFYAFVSASVSDYLSKVIDKVSKTLNLTSKKDKHMRPDGR